MLDELKKLQAEIRAEFEKIKNSEELKNLEVRYLGRKGELTQILRQLKDLSLEEKKKVGALANEIKNEFSLKINEIRGTVVTDKKAEKADLTLPGTKFVSGHLHPLSKVQYRLEDIFTSMGFMVLDGPELESEYFNFDALNMPANHPARDMQDTFFVEEGKGYDPRNRLVMRTQTSPVQVRAMRKYGAPLRLVVPGRCFRYEATDACHESTFYQMEGLMVDKDISIAHLISVMKTLLAEVFKKEVKIRLRPGYFPFVEPAFELDINCLICNGAGCPTCKYSGWLEVLPCGPVHPNVILAGGLDPKEWTGFAFGLGLTRLVMMKYGIDDIRLLNSGDLRFLEQF